MTDDRDAAIRALLDQLAELAGDPTDLELRTAFGYYREHEAMHDKVDTLKNYVRLVSRINDEERRDRWCLVLAKESGTDVRSVRKGASSYR